MTQANLASTERADHEATLLAKLGSSDYHLSRSDARAVVRALARSTPIVPAVLLHVIAFAARLTRQADTLAAHIVVGLKEDEKPVSPRALARLNAIGSPRLIAQLLADKELDDKKILRLEALAGNLSQGQRVDNLRKRVAKRQQAAERAATTAREQTEALKTPSRNRK